MEGNNAMTSKSIYDDEIALSLSILKRFKETWRKSHRNWNYEVFQFADDEFYKYRFMISREEQGSMELLTRILSKMFDKYKISVEWPNGEPKY